MRHPYAEFVHKVARPARYLGGEYLSVRKDPATVDARICLAFPDVYEIGSSHLGTKILYSILNKHPRIACERSFAPWIDMEAELRTRGLPLVSLESAVPLSDFDAVGISMQYELTYSNILTLLDLGGIPLRAADRRDADALVIGGGPTATHPEPLAPFFDAFYIGDAEEELPPLLLEWSAMRRSGRARLDALAELAAKYPIYVPALYDVALDERSELLCVSGPKDPRVPAKVRRAVVQNLNDYPFPSDSPVPYAEAVFDRAAIEIARGCTEGCRFCQAGMIYRPVRERSPESIVETIVKSVETAGYDETSLTCLSTADFSCITPLVKKVMSELRERKVALSVSSLRAYGLNEELLDELASVRATGLTFAPEAGTQRMRDVINKNVTEEHIRESAERVFTKGWSRLKLYFMIGQPTETDEDVRGIIETGARMLEIGKHRLGGSAEVTVSVSSHVPKPHTPFQWCAMDTLEEITRKQKLLRETARVTRPSVKLKYHEKGISFVEGVFARGDRRLGDVLEAAWRDGARFDGWDECFDLDRWLRTFEAHGIEPRQYLDTIPTDARLPWDHIDMGLADGFLAWEYRRALKDRLSVPCGKPNKTLLHHTNLEEAEADHRKLVCYDCGVACDLTQMREERLVYLRQLGAEKRPEPRAFLAPAGGQTDARPEHQNHGARPKPRPQFTQGEGTRYRLRHTKLGRAAFISHLDVVRLLARIFRRADLPVLYSLGFHPMPQLVFGPALGLGMSSLGEMFEVKLDVDLPAATVVDRLNEVCPEGLRFTGGRKVTEGEPGLSKVVRAADFVFWAHRSEMKTWDAAGLQGAAAELLKRADLLVTRGDDPEEEPTDRRARRRPPRTFDARPFVFGLDVLEGTAAQKLAGALSWDTPALLTARLAVGPEGSVKPSELAAALGLGEVDIARMALVGLDLAGKTFDPLDIAPAAFVSPPPLLKPVPPVTATAVD